MADFPFKDRLILLDSCVLEYLDDEDLRPSIVGCLNNVVKNKNTLALSEYLRFELLRGAFRKVETRMMALIDNFQRYQVTEEILIAAAQLETLYKELSVNSGISDGDKILASTAILTNGLILTANLKDFPPPFFKYNFRELIERHQKRYSQPIAIGILEPDFEIIIKNIEARK